MHPVNFEGAREYKKPESMTDEECFSVYAAQFQDIKLRSSFVTAWLPNADDLKAINAGLPIYFKMMTEGLYPHIPFTIGEDGICNDPSFDEKEK